MTYLLGPYAPKVVSAFKNLLAKVTLAPPAPITMYDSVDITKIPADAAAVAGYVGGYWPTYAKLVTQFPKALHLSIAVNASENAEVLDIEQGDAVNSDAAPWVKRQYARGVKRPGVYTSISNAETLLDVLSKAGVPRSEVRLWTAHYTGVAHRCSHVCGFGFTDTADATQYNDHAKGLNLDVSECAPTFFAASV